MWNFFSETFSILIGMSLKFVPKGSINNMPTVIQIIAWCQTGDKLLSEPVMAYIVVHWRIYASLGLNEY